MDASLRAHGVVVTQRRNIITSDAQRPNHTAPAPPRHRRRRPGQCCQMPASSYAGNRTTLCRAAVLAKSTNRTTNKKQSDHAGDHYLVNTSYTRFWCRFLKSSYIRRYIGQSNKKPRYQKDSGACCAYKAFTWWLGAESNHRHADFQSAALPTELPSQDSNYSHKKSAKNNFYGFIHVCCDPALRQAGAACGTGGYAPGRFSRPHGS